MQGGSKGGERGRVRRISRALTEVPLDARPTSRDFSHLLKKLLQLALFDVCGQVAHIDDAGAAHGGLHFAPYQRVRGQSKRRALVAPIMAGAAQSRACWTRTRSMTGSERHILSRPTLKRTCL